MNSVLTGRLIARIGNLSVHYPLRREWMGLGPERVLRAVQDVSLDLHEGEILGLVGESGCGKSTLGKAIVRLVRPTEGEVEMDGIDYLALRGEALRRHRPIVQMVFQDPYASLDPRMTVSDILAEPLTAHAAYTRAKLEGKIDRALSLVGIPKRDKKRYPHEFSGGQRQRIAVARALILNPKVIIADEPVSSLDVSVQAQILNLLRGIQQDLGLSMLFISHNLAVMKYLADRIAVMYLGKIVETAGSEDLFANPQHPYTRALLSSVPIPDPRKERNRVFQPLTGEIPSPVAPPPGCAFHTRCPLVHDRCRKESPLLQACAAKHSVSCFAVAKP